MTTHVTLVGNFVVPWTTESHLARALRENGCDVLEWPQDNAHAMGAEPFADRILLNSSEPHSVKTRETARTDLVLYVRTHNATALGPVWTHCWQRLQAAGVKTASFHLDRFFDLSREHLVWDHDPLFTTQHVFTADGGNDDRFAQAGVNHHWLPPAVDREEAEWGITVSVQSEYPFGPQRFDVIFAGSGGNYHGEYPQRVELIEHLRSVYGRRFAHVGHGGDFGVVRGKQLNALYQQTPIVVGDSCFANHKDIDLGKPNRYWSDRIPETIGRGGFLIHPWVPGLRDHYGPDELATYNPGDWDDLDARIGEFLANPGEREGYVERGRARVLREHTYTVRMRTLLETVGLRRPEPAVF